MEIPAASVEAAAVQAAPYELQHNDSMHSRRASISLRPTYSSGSGHSHMRTSIDSLTSPSFKEAAAAVTAYDTVTVDAVRGHSIWELQTDEADDATSGPVAAEQDQLDCAFEPEGSSEAQGTAMQTSARSLPAAAGVLAGPTWSGAAGSRFSTRRSSLAESAVFENKLFYDDNQEGADEEEGALVAAGSLRLSSSTLGGTMRTPRVSDSVLLRSLGRTSQQGLGFAAAVAAAAAAENDAAAAADIAAAVAAASPLVQSAPLSVYRNATFEEDEHEAARRGGSSSSSNLGGARAGLPPLLIAPWSPAVSSKTAPATALTDPAGPAGTTGSGRGLVGSSVFEYPHVQAHAAAVAGAAGEPGGPPARSAERSSPVPLLNLQAVAVQAAAAEPDAAIAGFIRPRGGNMGATQAPAAAEVSGTYTAGVGGSLAAAPDAGNFAAPSQAAADDSISSSCGDAVLGSPCYSQHSSVWSSPMGAHEGHAEQQQLAFPPPSPGLSLAELSIGGPIDLDGSEADSDLLTTSRTDLGNMTHTSAGGVAEAAGPQAPAAVAAAAAATAAAAAAAVVQWQAQMRDVIGSLIASSSSGSTSSAENSGAGSCSEGEEEYIEVHSTPDPDADGTLGRHAAVLLNAGSARFECVEAGQAQGQHVEQQRRRWQQLQHPAQQEHELEGDAGWLMSSEDEDVAECGTMVEQQPLVPQQQQQQHYAASEEGGGGSEFEGELPVLRIQGGSGYEPYDSDDDDDDVSEFDCGVEGEEGCAASGGCNTAAPQLQQPQDVDVGLAISAGERVTQTAAAAAAGMVSASSIDYSSRAEGQRAGRLLGYYKSSSSAGGGSDNTLSRQLVGTGTAVAGGAGLAHEAWLIAAGSLPAGAPDIVAAAAAAVGERQSKDLVVADCSDSSCSSDTESVELTEQEPCSAVSWVHKPPSPAWLSGPRSFRLAVHTSNKPSSGTRTRVSP